MAVCKAHVSNVYLALAAYLKCQLGWLPGCLDRDSSKSGPSGSFKGRCTFGGILQGQRDIEIESIIISNAKTTHYPRSDGSPRWQRQTMREEKNR